MYYFYLVKDSKDNLSVYFRFFLRINPTSTKFNWIESWYDPMWFMLNGNKQNTRGIIYFTHETNNRKLVWLKIL